MDQRRRASGVDIRGIAPRSVLVAGGTAAALALAVIVLWRAPLAILLVLVSTVLAVALDHPSAWLQRHHLPRWAALSIVVVVALAVVVGILFLLVPPAAAQIEELVRDAPTLLDRVRHASLYRRLDQWIDVSGALSHLQERVAARPSGVAMRALNAAGATLTAVGGVVTVFFLTLFMLLYGRELVGGALGLVPERPRGRLRAVLVRLHRVLGAYVLGLAGVCTINGVATAIVLGTMGVPFFLPLAVLSGCASLIPVVGALLAGVVITITAWVALGLWYGVGVIIFYVVYQQIENHVIGPLVYKRTVEVNPLASMLTLVFAAELWGIAGAVLAVPALAAGHAIVGGLRDGAAGGETAS